MTPTLPEPDRPWLMRTYSGHSTAKASNELYRTNLAKGQTGLSIAFDLPTQTGYDPDHPLAKGEVGKVGVPVAHLGHMEQAARRHPARRDEHVDDDQRPGGLDARASTWPTPSARASSRSALRGTTQNDIVKEYLSRGTYIFPPLPSRRLIVDMVAYCAKWVPKWNPMNVCSYHLQEAGATPTQELAYSLATAVGVLDAVKESGQVDDDRFSQVFASISFFVNAGIRFVEENAKMRAFTQMWERIGRERYGVTDPKALRFRYGVQVNSLGLTEAQPENNVQRIVLEMLGVTLSRSARARSLQLPAWNEALGLPRPWDQQWALRMQQVLAFETDLLEYPDIFEGSKVVEGLTDELVESASAELDDVLAMGGAFEAIDELKGRLVRSHAERVRHIEDGELTVVGVNKFTETAPSPLTAAGGEGAILKVDPALEAQIIAELDEWRAERDNDAVKRSLDQLRQAAESGENIMAATIDLAHAGGTTGEWAGLLREVFGEYRAPTGVAAAVGAGGGSTGLRAIAERAAALAGRPAPAAGGQAGPRRPLQRRRADRRGRPRRRHGGHLPGHPPDARADRGGGDRGGRRRHRPVDPLGLAPRAGAYGRAPRARRRHRRPDRGRRHHPRGGPPAAPRRGRGRRLHPQGLRARPDHGRDPPPRLRLSRQLSRVIQIL